jgi:hypothetical protein
MEQELDQGGAGISRLTAAEMRFLRNMKGRPKKIE